MLKRVFWFIIYGSRQWELWVGLSGIPHPRGFAAMVSLSPSVHSLTSGVTDIVYQAALSNYWEPWLLEWRSNKMLVDSIKCVFGLVCSLWKRVLHAPAFHSRCLVTPRLMEGCSTAATLFHPSFRGSAPVSSLLYSDVMGFIFLHVLLR